MDLSGNILLFALFLFLILVLYGFREEKRQKAERAKRRDARFGKRRKLSVSPEIMQKLAQEEADSQIDSITWNDLEMDEIFGLLDHTSSFAGREYLYHLLRNPRSEKPYDLASMSSFFEEERKLSLLLASLLESLTSKQKSPFRTRLAGLKQAKEGERGKYLWAACLALFSMLLVPIIPPVGVLLTFICLVRNALLHSNTSRQYEAHLSAAQDVMRMLAVGRAFLALDRESGKEELHVCFDGLEALLDRQKELEHHGKVLLSTYGSANGPVGVAMSYINLFFLRDLLAYCKVQKLLIHHEKDLVTLWEMLGRLDLAVSLSSVRASLSGTCIPKVIADQEINQQVSFEAKGIYHPMLEQPVKNDLTLSGNLLLTGSNASGKSTFLKAVAINSILAEALSFACADQLTLSEFQVVSSMALRDHLTRGESFFLAEIKSLKRILNAADQGKPLLCVIDEVLRGTNTVERIAASTEILRLLARDHVLCLAATHDIELTKLLSDCYRNAHFEEMIDLQANADDITFPYLLQEGPSQGKNAIRLLSIAGFPAAAVNCAEQRAKNYEATASWE